MPDEWPGNVKRVCEIGSQRGHGYVGTDSFDTVVNAFLERGWRILQTYVEGRGQGVCDECVFIMGWTHDGEPDYPPGYEEADPNEDDENDDLDE